MDPFQLWDRIKQESPQCNINICGVGRNTVLSKVQVPKAAGGYTSECCAVGPGLSWSYNHLREVSIRGDSGFWWAVNPRRAGDWCLLWSKGVVNKIDDHLVLLIFCDGSSLLIWKWKCSLQIYSWKVARCCWENSDLVSEYFWGCWTEEEILLTDIVHCFGMMGY